MRGILNTHLLGRITKKPELRYSKDGTPLCFFSVAVNRKWGGNETTDFMDVKSFRQTAEVVAKFTDKGTVVFVSGDLVSRKYTGKDGLERKIWEIQADQVELLSGSSQDHEPDHAAPVTEEPSPSTPQFADMTQADIPF